MHIVLGSDGSIEADIASAILKRLPLPKDVRVTVAMATNPVADMTMAFAPEQASVAYSASSESWKIQKQIAEQTVSNLSKRIAEAGFRCTPQVLQGDPGAELMSLAKNLHAEIIAVGSGANNRMTAFILGSVSRKLLLYADTSILVGRQMDSAEEEGTYARLRSREKLDVLVAYDGSPGSELAIQTLSRLDNPAFGRVTLLMVNERMPELTGLEGLEEEEGSTEHGLRQLASQARERILNSADSIDILIAGGPASQTIANKAKELDVDLIMIGANRHGVMERLIVGSCAYETMLAAPCSVLVIRHQLPFEN